MNYSHLSIEERSCIREYYNSGKSFREIASLIGRSHTTISREINRNKSYMNCKPAYYPSTAQKKYKYRRRYGLLREFYPKGRNPSKVSEKTLKKNLALINARPKKILNYQTPADLFEQELNKVLRLV